MNITFLRSRVARRIFALFVLCALLPIAALAIISFLQVTRQLKEQSFARLQQASKSLGMSTVERLRLLETEMRMIGSRVSAGVQDGILPPQTLGENLQERFKGLERVTEDGRHIAVLGRVGNRPTLTPAAQRHILSGKTVVSSAAGPNGNSGVFMSCAIDPRNPARGMLLAEINTTYLWSDYMLPPRTELCVLSESQQILSCTRGTPPSIRAQFTAKTGFLSRGQFEWNDAGKEFLASYWMIPLRFDYFTPGWTVVLSESNADVLAPVAKFKQTFPLVILMALWVVLLLSIAQIRRSLVPLEKLQEGTHRIAGKDFDSRVTVTSGDEFEELAGSFNAMAYRLGRQFNALTTISEIDRAVLSALDTEKIVETVLTRLPEILPCDFASVTLLEPETPGTVRTYVPGTGKEKWWRLPVRPEDMQKLRDHPQSLLISADEDLPTFLAPLKRFGVHSILLLPIFLEQELSGIINVGYRNSPTYTPDDLAPARQLADQVAVALSNARLIEKLRQLSWGTLTALARAIDAKSGWTGGHSERVTSLAMELAQVMGYKGKDLERMHRGGLLHDIGKIGTPANILDKPGKLTPEELKIMREHVKLGAHILEPIPGFSELLPIVLHHHEWFDGSGYPAGLAGEAISLEGRIFAVADCFDALASDRPYRAGLPRERVIAMIEEGSGRQFDPKVVEAFDQLMKQKEAAQSKASKEFQPAPEAVEAEASVVATLSERQKQ